MSRYIDADALIAWIKESQQMTSKMRNIICKIESMPDAVEVVRCKDCKWRKACKVFSQQQITDDSYCSWGEREGE